MLNNQLELLSDISGHVKNKEFLCSLALQSNLPQVIALIGPKGVGKFSLLTLWLAKILSLNPNNKSDSYYLDAEINGGVDSVRQFLVSSSLSPVNSIKNLMILDNADSLTRESANVLLKTLEEPSPKSLFFLICHSKNLPQTVFSRCLTLNFSKLSLNDLRHIAKSKALAPTEDELKLSGGSAGRLIEILTSEDFQKNIMPATKTLHTATSSHLSERLLAIQDLSELDASQLEQAIWNLIYLIKQEDMLISKLSLLSRLLRALDLLKSNINKKLILQSILLKNL